MKRPPVTDHAVIRYLERARGVDIDAIRAEIADLCRRGLDQGACGVLIGGLEFRIEGGAIVTCQYPTHPDKRTGRVRRRREFDE
ncbi:MAG: hypothetical protein Q8K20_14010 [Gemmobacter sp.]|nr:hypothetical protein [Gemmobacter sp.]